MISIKEFEEMTDAQLVGVTQEECQILEKLYMMEEGIAIVPEPEYEELRPVDSPNLHLFASRCFDDFLFKNTDDIEKAKQYMRDLVYRKAGSWRFDNMNVAVDFYKDQYGDHIKDEYSPVAYYSRDMYDKNKTVLKENSQIEKRNAAKKEEWKKSYNDAESIRRKILNKIGCAHDFLYERKKYDHIFSEYLDLSGGKPFVAYQFFVKAHHIDDEILKYLREKYNVIEEVQACCEEPLNKDTSEHTGGSSENMF